MLKKYYPIALLVLFFIAACARKSSLPVAGTASKFTYVADVKPVLDASCSPCHMPAKGGKKEDFDSYEAAKRNIADIIYRVQLDSSDVKFMPWKHKKPSLTPAQIAMLKDWANGGMIRE